MDKWLWMLSAMRIMTRGEGDCNVVKSRNGSIQADFQAWKLKFLSRLKALMKGEKKGCSGNCKSGSCKSKRKDGPGEEEEKAASHDNGSEVKAERQRLHVINHNSLVRLDSWQGFLWD